MAALTRDVVFRRLGAYSMQSLHEAYGLAGNRGDAYIEPLHWFACWLRRDDSDVALILERLGDLRPQVQTDIAAALARLRPGHSSHLDFSAELELAVERGWISASLVLEAPRIRTGHLLHGMLDEPRLARFLWDMSPAFKKLDAATLRARFAELTRDSTEEGEATPAEHAAGGRPVETAGEGGEDDLARYASDLTEEARSGRLDPIVGRDREIREVIDILQRRRQNNPIILGEAGVGKTALVEGLALRVARGEVPPALRDVRILSLDIAALQAGASMRGEFEARLKKVVTQAQASPRPVILFIDEAHTLIGAGGNAGTGDAANLLKPALARGTLRTIAATTRPEYKRHIEKDQALVRRFAVVDVEEPAEPVAIAMLRKVAPALSRHHEVEVLDAAIVAAVRLSQRYIQGQQLPDKAVAVLDMACARVAASQSGLVAEIEDGRRQLELVEAERLTDEEERRVGTVDPARTARLADELASGQEELSQLQRRHEQEQPLVQDILERRRSLRENASEAGLAELREREARLKELQGDRPLVLPAVDEHAVAAVISTRTGIPVGRMLADQIDAVLSLAETLKGRVIGQDHALDAIARRVLTARAGIESPDKPKAVFLLVGPSGVGKTETALALADQLFGSDRHLITVNMSEFQESHAISTLKGSPPGYVGYGEGGRLTEAVRRKPYSVVLLDEFEKAHPDVHELFFQVFDKGVMEDGEGRRVDFTNTIILLTSNVGSDLIMQLCANGSAPAEPAHLQEQLRRPLLQAFPAALLGRLVTIPYVPLSDSMLDRIIVLQLERIRARVAAQRSIEISYDPAVVALLRARCHELESGGRMIDTILTASVLPSIARLILVHLKDEAPLAKIAIGVEDSDFTYAAA